MSNVIIQAIGRLGQDAVIKSSEKGNQYMSFTLAVNEFNQGKEETTWFQVNADLTNKFMKMHPFLKKGSLVNVNGLESVGLFTDSKGVTRIGRNIRAMMIDFISSGKSNHEANNVKTNTSDEPNVEVKPSANMAKVMEMTKTTVADDDDDLPF